MSRPEFDHAVWRKSSYSGGNGDCVEVAFTGWHKSSYSNANGGCVEVATADALVGVRDSKHPTGPVLVFTPQEWSAFLAGVRRGEFD